MAALAETRDNGVNFPNLSTTKSFCTVYSGNLHVPAIFHFDRLSVCGDIANLRFLIWRPPAILNLWNMQILTFLTVCSQNMPIYIKFRRDRLNVWGDIAIFFIFSVAAVRHFECLRYVNFYSVHGLQWQCTCSCKLSSRSVERLGSYYKLNIFNMAAVHHLKFVVRTRGTTHDASLMVRRSPENFVQIGWAAVEIERFFHFEVFAGNPNLRSNFGGFSEERPNKVVSYHRDPQKAPMVTKTRRMSYNASKSVQRCLL